MRTHAESIAFFGGGAREGQTVAAQYGSLMGHLRRVVNIRYGSACSQHDWARWSPSARTWHCPDLGSLRLHLLLSTASAARQMFHRDLGLTRTDFLTPLSLALPCIYLFSPLPGTALTWTRPWIALPLLPMTQCIKALARCIQPFHSWSLAVLCAILPATPSWVSSAVHRPPVVVLGLSLMWTQQNSLSKPT